MKSDSGTPPQKTDEIRKIHRYALICSLIWTLLIFGLLVAENLQEFHEHGRSMEGAGGVVVSVTVPIVPVHEAMKSKIQVEALIFLCIWLSGLGFIWFGTRKIVSTMTLLHDERNSLRESDERLRVIFEASVSGIIVVSPQGVIDFANRRMAEMLGMTLQELIGTHYLGYLHESEKQIGDERMRKLMKGEIQLVSLDRLYVRGDGTEFWGNLSGRRLENQDGSLRALVGVITDITERKLVEDELRKSEAKQRAMIENIVDVIAILDRDGINRYDSPNIEKWFGWRTWDVVGSAIWDNIHPDDLKSAQKVFADILGEPGAAKTAECLFRCRDGRYKWIEYTADNLLHDPNVAGVLFSYHDITERKRAEMEHRRLEHQFHHAQKMESLGVLAGGIAHDFNNILAVIMGQCFMARKDTDLQKTYEQYFMQIETAAGRAAVLCRQMLTYAGRTEFVQTRLSLGPLVEEVTRMIQSAIKKNVTIELDLKCDIPEIDGDVSQIQQILMNLIINSAEAIGDANGTIRIALAKTAIMPEQTFSDVFGTTIHAGNYACLEISDTGCGMDEETQKRIFEPFYTTKFTGRGLGMSAICGIIKAHDAALQLTSKPDVGTNFKIFFHMPEASIDAIAAPIAPVLTEKGGGAILLVEDEQTLLNMGEVLLETFGFSVITAENGHEAIETYLKRGGEIDVILLDLIMPVMGGIEAYHELRKISSTVPIIICSGYSIESVKGTIDNDEHAKFMNKPYNPLELRDVLVKMME